VLRPPTRAGDTELIEADATRALVIIRWPLKATVLRDLRSIGDLVICQVFADCTPVTRPAYGCKRSSCITPTEVPAEENFLAFPLAPGIKAVGGAKGCTAISTPLLTTPTRACTRSKIRTQKYALDLRAKDAYKYPDPKITYSVFSMEDGTVQHVWANAMRLSSMAETISTQTGRRPNPKTIWMLHMHVNPDPALQVALLADTRET
jgi:hypothetical protein